MLYSVILTLNILTIMINLPEFPFTLLTNDKYVMNSSLYAIKTLYLFQEMIGKHSSAFEQFTTTSEFLLCCQFKRQKNVLITTH